MAHTKTIENWLPQLTESIGLRSAANNRSATRLGEFEVLHMANIADCYALLSDEEARTQACAISSAIHSFYRCEISIELAAERVDSVWDSSGPDEHHTMLRLIASTQQLLLDS
jgi:hypothetical protein